MKINNSSLLRHFVKDYHLLNKRILNYDGLIYRKLYEERDKFAEKTRTTLEGNGLKERVELLGFISKFR